MRHGSPDGIAARRTLCFVVIAILTTVLSCLGCGGEKGPETVPVKGRIEFTKGGSVENLYDSSTIIEFESIDQPGVMAHSAIEKDGTFNLATVAGDVGKKGAVPGVHRVRLNADESGARDIHRKFLSFDTSDIKVTVPSDGEIVIKVWK